MLKLFKNVSKNEKNLLNVKKKIIGKQFISIGKPNITKSFNISKPVKNSFKMNNGNKLDCNNFFKIQYKNISENEKVLDNRKIEWKEKKKLKKNITENITNNNLNIESSKEKLSNIKLKNKFETTISNKSFFDKYENLMSEEKHIIQDVKEKIAGRIISIRKLGKLLTFISISSNGEEMQLVLDINILNDSSIENLNSLKRGFIIGAEGNPYRTKTGETSLLASNLDILSICNFELPDTNRKDKQILTDFETRYEKRYLDLIVNNKNKEYYILRSKIINFLRSYLEKDGYLEAETPILSKKAGGALATPFETYSQALKTKLFLRIAPELFLKQLIIGGYEKVFEIGKNFRNEDISIRHNPEFTTCELYKAYSDYNFMINFTKNFLRDLCIHLYGKSEIDIEVDDPESEKKTQKIKIDFTEPYNVYDVNEELEKYFNTNLSNIQEKDLYYEKLDKLYEDFLNDNKDFRNKTINRKYNFSLKKKIDKLIENIIEPRCIKPSFIKNHPILLSPLAKAQEENKNIAERFEFFINKIELINSYSELNEFNEQKLRFIEQNCHKKNNEFDDEIHPNDEEFLEALSYGMPPTAGWGLGIDRLCMVFLGLSNIKEIILFPLMNVKKNKENNNK